MNPEPPPTATGPSAGGDVSQAPESRGAGGSIFRAEALEHQASPQHEGHLLELSPAWTRWAYWLLLGVCGAALLYGTLGRVNEYAAGPAIVKAEGRTDLPARAAGTVASIAVRPGQHVVEGEVLVKLYAAEEAAELQRIEHEFELLLVKTLRDPGDAAARAALTVLRTQRELSQARLEERTLRAPRAGIVSDLRTRAGQHLAPGEVILSLAAEQPSFRVIAMLPGQYRPLLHPGMPLRLELAGYQYAYQRLTIDAIGDEVVGPGEVKRYLGQEVGDAVRYEGPIVLVEAHLPAGAFVAGGRTLAFYEGLQGNVEARVRSESLLVTLVPALKAVLPDG